MSLGKLTYTCNQYKYFKINGFWGKNKKQTCPRPRFDNSTMRKTSVCAVCEEAKTHLHVKLKYIYEMLQIHPVYVLQILMGFYLDS